MIKNKTNNKIIITFILLLFISSNSICFANNFVKLNKTTKEHSLEIQETNIGVANQTKIIDNSEELSQIIEKQKENDLKDLEILWKATVENNPVIEFALKKLATPESQRRIHSSMMAKSLSAIISGASFIPSLMGTNPAVQTSAFSAGRLAQNYINKKNVPQEIPLTDTELIELASIVEELQDNLISSYYNYKNTLMQLKATRRKLLLYSKNYSQSLTEDNAIETVISSNLYNSMILEELTLEEETKKYYIQLQRLAGKTAVKSLELNQYDFDTILYKKNSATTEIKKELNNET